MYSDEELNRLMETVYIDKVRDGKLYQKHTKDVTIITKDNDEMLLDYYLKEVEKCNFYNPYGCIPRCYGNTSQIHYYFDKDFNRKLGTILPAPNGEYYNIVELNYGDKVLLIDQDHNLDFSKGYDVIFMLRDYKPETYSVIDEFKVISIDKIPEKYKEFTKYIKQGIYRICKSHMDKE